MKYDKATPENARSLVAELITQNSGLWQRWLELERANNGIGEIALEVRRFIFVIAEGGSPNILNELLLEMRRIAYQEAKKPA